MPRNTGWDWVKPGLKESATENKHLVFASDKGEKVV